MLIKIISGGQTGVDQGALDAAIQEKIPHGGHCPKGRKSENGMIPERFLLEEAWSDQYPPRTRMNIRNADGTLILIREGASESRGTVLTLKECAANNKPWHVADPRNLSHVERVVRWVQGLQDQVEGVPGWLPELKERDRALIINVAGARESREPGIHDETVAFVRSVLAALKK